MTEVVTGGDPPECLRHLFAPVIWLYENSSTYETYIDWQLELFDL